MPLSIFLGAPSECDLRIDVECLDAVLTDLSERWPARLAPTHAADGLEGE